MKLLIQLNNTVNDLNKLIKNFNDENKNFDIFKLVIINKDSYLLIIKADWLIEIYQKEGLKTVITTITHKMYNLYKNNEINSETINLINDIDIIINDKDLIDLDDKLIIDLMEKI